MQIDQWRYSDVFINSEHILHLFRVFLLLTLNRLMFAGKAEVSYVLASVKVHHISAGTTDCASTKTRHQTYFVLLLLLLFSQGLILFATSFFNLGGTLSTVCLQRFKFKYQNNLLVIMVNYVPVISYIKFGGQVGVIVESL